MKDTMHLVPLLPKWTGSETKLDLKGIYRRPDPAGITLTGPLPLRRHMDWVGKGYEFVTLATQADLALVQAELRALGYDAHAMLDCYDRQGHFNVEKYLDVQSSREADRLADLQEKVDKFGADAVVEMMRVQEPGFRLPAGIKTKPAKHEKAGKDDKDKA
jgi:hypothetical protein